ncbi:MAG: tripartite tricarboxylate transporter TctB family protein [Planctomycetota bacterium]|jgi:hypothetical protein|nr:tripartite tricarboxylate transporter TctB family protein [Planctomycetota bacterium]
MHKSDAWSAGAFIAAALVFIIGALRLGVSSPTSDGVPGAGFFPFAAGAVIVILSSAQVVMTLRHKGEGKDSFRMEAEQRGNLAKLFATILAMLGLFVIWKLVAFEAAALAFSLFVNWVYGRGWLFNLVFSAVMVGLIHIMFVRVLFIQFEL